MTDEAVDAAGAAPRRRPRGIRLVALILLTAALFAATLTLARQVRARTLRDAAIWAGRGAAAMSAGRMEEAAEAYRRAVASSRENRSYVLGLSLALTRANLPDAAERALLSARASSPEDPSFNLELARLAALRGDTDTAVRYYRNALYAPWPSADGPRRIRGELIELLLASGEERRALPEVLAATTDLPDTVEDRFRVAGWFARTGEHRRALDQFERVLAAEPDNAQALEGAGFAAYALGDYARAARYLARAPASDAAARARDVSELVLAMDPLAPRIASTERRRRLVAAAQHVAARLAACAPDSPRIREIDALTRRLARRPDLDDITTGFEMVSAAHREIRASCDGADGPRDEALRLIASRHEGDNR
jgi:tetratricopeptide (TPR) repeat protein